MSMEDEHGISERTIKTKKVKPVPLKQEKKLGYQSKGPKPLPLKREDKLGYQGKGAKPVPLKKPR